MLHDFDNFQKEFERYQDDTAELPSEFNAETPEFYKAAARPLSYFDDFDKVIKLDWVLKNLLAKGHTSYLFGPPGGGKSALYGSAATFLGAGAKEWHGFKIRNKAASVFFAMERHDLVKKRIWAECQREGFGNVPVAVCPGIINLMDPRCVEEIVGTMLAAEDQFGISVEVAVLDTFGKGIAAGNGEENSAKDQNRAWGHLRQVHEIMSRWHTIHRRHRAYRQRRKPGAARFKCRRWR
jgi:AAA domain